MTFWQTYWLQILIAVTLVVLGGVLRPAAEAGGRKLWDSLSGLASRFRRRYIEYLLDEYRILSMRGRSKARPEDNLQLEQIFVSLRVNRPDFSGENDGFARFAPSPALNIGQAMARSKRVVIIGAPGSGKTTLLIYLLLTYARNKSKERLHLSEKSLPIFIPLRQLKTILSAAEKASLPDYLNKTYAKYGLEPPPDFFEKALNAGKCLVLLDGLDEVATPEERLKMAKWVDGQVSIYSKNRFIVSSRPAGYNSAPLGNNFTRLDMQDFSQTDIEEFCRNWYLARELAERGEDSPALRRRVKSRAANLIDAIARNSAVRKLAVNPLQLSIIALVHRNRPLPRRRADLYTECVDVLLGKWDEAKGLMQKLTESEKRGVLQPLALYMHQKRVRELETKAMQAQLAKHLPTVGGAAEDAPLFLQEIRERSGLLQESNPEIYTFSHFTFQEYLAARQILDLAAEDILLKNVGDEWWQEVTLLYSGLKDATSVVQALLDLDELDKKEHAPLILAGRCLVDAQKVEPSVKQRTIARLEDYFNNAQGQPFLEAGLVLAELDKEEALARFLQSIAGQSQARRKAALWAVEEMLNEDNETQRRIYWRQLWQSFAGWQSSQPARLVLAELAKSGSNLWRQEVVAWLEQNRQDPAWLKAIVTQEQIHLSQFLTHLLNYDETVESSVLCLDNLLILVPGFQIRIARYPVTNAQYARFVNTGGYNNQKWWSRKGWQDVGQKKKQPDYWKDKKWKAPAQPVVGLSWYEAEAYSAWLSAERGQEFRLPTEEEWQRAAQGDDERQYPWGDAWQEGVCNTSESGIGQTTLVGQFSPAGDSPIGCADMSGNVWEWTGSWYDSDKDTRVLRGGSWLNFRNFARCAVRYYYDSPYYCDSLIGVRLVAPI